MITCMLISLDDRDAHRAGVDCNDCDGVMSGRREEEEEEGGCGVNYEDLEEDSQLVFAADSPPSSPPLFGRRTEQSVKRTSIPER